MRGDTLLERALSYASRREHLGKNAVPCPECGTNQVQLIDHFVTPARFKCRRCKAPFQHEPEVKLP